MNCNTFDLNNMEKCPAICIIAERGSGKSVLVKDLIYTNYSNSDVYIISPTEKMNPFYEYFCDENKIYHEYKEDIIKNIILTQKEKIKNKTSNIEIVVVLDDCLSSKGLWAKDSYLLDLLFNGRHYHISYILTMQFPLGITPELRCNFDYVFLLADDFVSNKKRMYEHYAGMFPDFNSFNQTFNDCTRDFGCMVINNRGARTSFFEKVFKYKAKIHDEKINNNNLKLTNNSTEELMNLTKFKLSNINKNSHILIIGARNTGKSILAKNIMNQYINIDKYIISPKDKFNKFYEKNDKTYIHYEYKKNTIENILSIQEEKQKNKINNSEIIVIFDECLSSDELWAKDSCLLELLFNGRHYKITYILIMQFPLNMTPELRNNFDYVFLLADDFVSNKKRIYNHYCGMFSNYDDFDKKFIEFTDNYGCMVINNQKPTNHIFDKIFKYQIEPCNNFNIIDFILNKNTNTNNTNNIKKDDIIYSDNDIDIDIDMDDDIDDNMDDNMDDDMNDDMNDDMDDNTQSEYDSDDMNDDFNIVDSNINNINNTDNIKDNTNQNITNLNNNNINNNSIIKLFIKKFNLSNMVKHSSIVIIGKNNTVQLQKILNKYTNDVKYIISPSKEKSMEECYNHMNNVFYYKYDSNVIENIIQLQKNKISFDKNNSEIVIVLNNCLNSLIINDKPIIDLLFNARHYNITYILTMHFPLGITPELRVNFDYVFLLADDFVSNKRRLYEHYCGFFPNFESFDKTFIEFTSNSDSMAINNRICSGCISDKISILTIN